MAEIDDLYEIMSGRKKWEDLPLKTLNQIESIGSRESVQGAPQLQPTVDITATADVNPIVPYDNAPKWAESYRETIGPEIKSRAGRITQYEDEKTQAGQQAGVTRAQLMDVIGKLSADTPAYKPKFDYQAEVAKVQKDIPKGPSSEDQMWTAIIESLGAPILGGLSGETGAIAQRPAQEKISSMAQERRKTEALTKAKLQEEVSKRILGLAKMQESDYAVAKDERNSRIDRLNKLGQMVQRLNENDEKGKQFIATQLQKEDENVSKLLESGAETYAKFGSEQEKEKIKASAAKAKKPETDPNTEWVPGYKLKPTVPVNKTDVPKLQKAIGDRETLVNLINTVMEKVKNTEEKDLINPFSQARKDIDSYVGDAQLLYKGPGFTELGVLAGPDVSYLEKVLETPGALSLTGGKAALIKRYQSAIDRINSKIENVMTAKGYTRLSPIQKMRKEEKTINGNVYEKTKDGWKLVK